MCHWLIYPDFLNSQISLNLKSQVLVGFLSLAHLTGCRQCFLLEPVVTQACGFQTVLSFWSRWMRNCQVQDKSSRVGTAISIRHGIDTGSFLFLNKTPGVKHNNRLLLKTAQHQGVRPLTLSLIHAMGSRMPFVTSSCFACVSFYE